MWKPLKRHTRATCGQSP